MTQHEWYYAVDANQMGPVGTDELKRLAASGELKPTTLVWRDGLSDWMPASRIPGLFAATAPAPAPMAAPAAQHAGGYTSSPAAPAPSHPAPAAVLPYGGGGAGAYGAGAGVTARAVDLLNQTRPWVLFVAVLSFIVTGLMVLGGVAMFFVGLMGSMSTQRSGLVGASGAGAGLIYVLFAVLYFFPGLYLTRYASRIAALRGTGRVEDLESALEAQKSFWKFVGIAVLVVVCLYVVLLAVLMAAAVM